MSAITGHSHLSGGTSPPAEADAVASAHPRPLGWIGTTALAMGGSNQSLFIIGAVIASQGTAAVPLLIIGLLLGWAAAPGWTELILMRPNRVGGIAASCAEAFRPYSPVLANLAGVCYWWGWVPTCGLTAILSGTALHEWLLHSIPVNVLATVIVLIFTVINLCGIRWVTRLAIPLAFCSAALAFLSAILPVLSGHVDWHQAASSFSLHAPFHGVFGHFTSAMAGLYLIGFAAPAFEAAACHVGETRDPARNVPRAMFASAARWRRSTSSSCRWSGSGCHRQRGPVGASHRHARTDLRAAVRQRTARAAAIFFMVFNMCHGTLQPLAGAARTLSQLSEDGLLPRILARRNRNDAPLVATLLTAGMSILFLLARRPHLADRRREPHVPDRDRAAEHRRRPAATQRARADTRLYRAPRGTIALGLIGSSDVGTGA